MRAGFGVHPDLALLGFRPLEVFPVLGKAFEGSSGFQGPQFGGLESDAARGQGLGGPRVSKCW